MSHTASEAPQSSSRSADPDHPDLWRRSAAALGPVTLRVAYQPESGDAVFDLGPNGADETRLVEGTGNLSQGIYACVEAGTGTISVRLYWDSQQELRYAYELTSASMGRLRRDEGVIADE